MKSTMTTLAALVVISAVGCGQDSQLDRKPVFGKIVGADGRSGIVTFISIDGKSGGATGSFEDGAYQFSKVDGPVPGNYNVSIVFEVTASSGPARGSGRSGRRNAAAAGRKVYEREKTTTVSVSVPADGPFEIDLDPN